MAYVSVFGRVNYNYADRYLLTASMRRDANSRFSKENRVGYFPSVAAAWNVHNESFFKQLPQVVSNLKLRTSYGELGNSQMANYQFQPVLNVEAGAVFGGVYQPGATVTNLVNRDVVWESTKSFNVGLDLGIFDNALSLSAEYYRNTTSDILFRVPVPFSAGTIDFPYVNAASMRNSGIELSLNLEKTTSNNFRYSLSGNISTVKNEILELGTDIPIYGAASITKEGGSLGELYGYKVDRLFQSADDVSSSPLQPNAKPGDIKFKDINGDNVINDNDRVVLGKSIPDFTYGFGANFAFKNFDLYTQFFGVHGNKIFNQPRQTIESGGRGRENQLTNQNVTWTPENPNTSNPRASIQDLNGNSTRASDRYVESGSYLRMTDLQLGYNFKSISKAFTNLRIYGSIQNVFVLTKYKGLDPEIVNVGNTFNRGFDPGSFPSPRTFMIGLQVGL
jgi:TonB-linked SusC/RagA family outer membrane protein